MQTKVNEKLFDGQSIYVGIDCHKMNWTVTILGEQYEHKTMSQNPDPDILASYLKRNFPGAEYNAVYEAGFNGFYPCRKLNQLGIITAYRAQNQRINERLEKEMESDATYQDLIHHRGFSSIDISKSIEIDTVDRFQGQEKENQSLYFRLQKFYFLSHLHLINFAQILFVHKDAKL